MQTLTMDTTILQPLVILVAWTMIMWLWMYVTRIPAIQKARMRLDPNEVNGVQMSSLPANVRWKADNYNHLMEQPTVFYAIVIVLALLGEGSDTNVMLAWGYVGLRIVHSLVQALVNKIEVRFGIFSLSSLMLIALVVNALCAVF